MAKKNLKTHLKYVLIVSIALAIFTISWFNIPKYGNSITGNHVACYIDDDSILCSGSCCETSESCWANDIEDIKNQITYYQTMSQQNEINQHELDNNVQIKGYATEKDIEKMKGYVSESETINDILDELTVELNYANTKFGIAENTFGICTIGAT